MANRTVASTLASFALFLITIAQLGAGASEEALLVSSVSRCDARADCLGVDERCFFARGVPKSAKNDLGRASPSGLCLSSTQFKSLLDQEKLPGPTEVKFFYPCE